MKEDKAEYLQDLAFPVVIDKDAKPKCYGGLSKKELYSSMILGAMIGRGASIGDPESRMKTCLLAVGCANDLMECLDKN